MSSEGEDAFKHPRFTVASAHHGPRANLIRGEAQAAPKRMTAEPINTEWPTHWSRRSRDLSESPVTLYGTRMGSTDAEWQAP